MTINSDLQKQQPGSELVTLFELEKPNGQFAYLTRGLDDDLSTLQMYDYDSPSTLRTYVALPITSDGFDIKVTGAISRPTLNVTLISTAFDI